MSVIRMLRHMDQELQADARLQAPTPKRRLPLEMNATAISALLHSSPTPITATPTGTGYHLPYWHPHTSAWALLPAVALGATFWLLFLPPLHVWAARGNMMWKALTQQAKVLANSGSLKCERRKAKYNLYMELPTTNSPRSSNFRCAWLLKTLGILLFFPSSQTRFHYIAKTDLKLSLPSAWTIDVHYYAQQTFGTFYKFL